MAQQKTNAMRILEQKKVSFNMNFYDNKDGKIDGISVAMKIGKDPEMVYKTLVCQGSSRNYYVFVIPVKEELDLKKAARAAEEKNMEMIAVKDIQKITGYIRGGCSPIGMKKEYKTFIDSSAAALEKIVVSGGKIGTQIEMKVDDLKLVVDAVLEDVIKQA
ncbi:MAG: Cys-tRNA(Pro) deacylase [Clostridiaceae bacterium]